jgi:hypothetical protein
VEQNPKLLRRFNTLDFSAYPEVRYIDGDCSFPAKVFNFWKVLEINFGSLTFLNNEASQSGFELFKGCPLTSLLKLDFGSSI